MCLVMAAVRRAPRREIGADDAAQEVVVRVLDKDCAALRRVRDSRTPLAAWLKSCLRNVCRETKKARGRERGGLPCDEVPDSAPSPDEVAAKLDETRFTWARVLHAIRILPRPYGHVAAWRVIEELPWQRIRTRLNRHRPNGRPPISERQAQHLVTVAVRMLRDACNGIDPRIDFKQRFHARKNPWIVANLPPLHHLPVGCQGQASREGQLEVLRT
jgi:DNA-directed RNA polymerase specialized sigma24 family protein